jgi:hypothetical protein
MQPTQPAIEWERRLISMGGEKRPGFKADLSPSSSVEIKKSRIYNFTPSHACISQCLISSAQGPISFLQFSNSSEIPRVDVSCSPFPSTTVCITYSPKLGLCILHAVCLLIFLTNSSMPQSVFTKLSMYVMTPEHTSAAIIDTKSLAHT